MTSETQQTAMNEKDDIDEIKWTDDKIRWTEEELKYKLNIDEDEDEGAAKDLFFDPHEAYSHKFNVVQNGKDGESSSIVSIDIQLQGYKFESHQTWQSTGLTLWRAAEYLCNFLVDQQELLQNKRIIELGAGLGLCGILVHRMTSLCDGSKETPEAASNRTVIFLTDGDTDALIKLRENVAVNRATTGTILCHQLLWGKEHTQKFLEKRCKGETFDILLASDIVYVPDIVEPLFETVQILLRPNGIFFLAYALRAVPVSIEYVLKIAAKAGFEHECIKDEKDIFLYSFRWKREKDVDS